MAVRGTARLLTTLLLLAVAAGGVSAQNASGDPFSLEEVLSGEYSPIGFSGTWTSGSAFLWLDQGNALLTDVTTQESTILAEQQLLEQFEPSSITLSADGRYLLLGYDVEPGFRHSSSSRFTAYDIAANTTTDIEGGVRLKLATWSPVGSALVYVLDNNMFYLADPTATPVALTSDGVPDVVYNGVADWVYEEEVLASGSALWWSPDGARIAFAHFNDTQVHEVSYMHYGSPGAMEDQYASVVTIRYPKAGTTNPAVELRVVAVPANGEEPVQQALSPPTGDSDEFGDPVLVSVVWADDSELVAVWTNRVQNLAQTVSYDATSAGDAISGQPGLLLSEPGGWLIPKTPTFRVGDASRYATVTSEPQGDAGNFPQLSIVSGANKTAVTSGQATVVNIYGWDANGTLYYQATEEGEPATRQVFSVQEGGTPVCLSCSLVSPEGRSCRYAGASFSTDFTHFAITCSGPDPAVVTIHNAADPTGNVTVWQDNAELREKLAAKRLPEKIDTWVDVADGLRAQVRLWLPPGLDTTAVGTTPAIVYVYAGPGSQQITDAFSIGWGAYLTTFWGYIYILIDGRGSDFKGDNTLFTVNRQLGTVEIQDQINVTRLLKEQFPFIDSSRTGIWGWSYGGYATAMTLAQDDEDVFKCGISVAPVTSWIYYDSIYTERYMGLPTAEDNLAGYNASDVTRLAERFVNKTYFLLHGNGDDNVHYQNGMMLARALEDAGVLFRQQSYPDENHSLGDVLPHVYRSMEQFWVDCFEEADPSAAKSSAAAMSRGLMALAEPIVRCLL